MTCFVPQFEVFVAESGVTTPTVPDKRLYVPRLNIHASAAGVAELPETQVPSKLEEEPAGRRLATKHFVLGFAAPIEGGKSTISTRLAEALHAPRVSFREYLEGVARKTGMPVTRESLQDLGENLVQHKMREFCTAVLRQASWAAETPLLIDGVRHLEVLKTLKELVAPVPFYLIYLNIDRKTQEERFQHDNLPHEKPLEELERHPTETQVSTVLRKKADLIVDGAAPVEQLVKEILDFANDSDTKSTVGEDWDAMNQRRAELIQKKSHEELTEDERAEFERLQRLSHETMERKFPRPRLSPDELDVVKKALGLPPEERGK